MTKNAKVTSPTQATSATQTASSWAWSGPAFVKRTQEDEARLDLQLQTIKDLQDQNKNQKKNYERELNGCIGTIVAALLIFAVVMIYGLRQSSSPERCSYAPEAKAVQMTATPATITVTLPVATNAVPTIEAAPAFNMTPTADQVWTGLTQGQIRSIIRENNKIQARFNENYRAWGKEENEQWWEQWEAQRKAQRSSEDQKFWSSLSSKYSMTPTPTPNR